MEELGTYVINDTIREIRAVSDNLKAWRDFSPRADNRHVAMVLTKLEEAELLAQRLVVED